MMKKVLLFSMVLLVSSFSSAGTAYNKLDIDACKLFVQKKINNKYISFKKYKFLNDGSILFTFKNINSIGFILPDSKDINFKCIPPKLLKYK